MIHNKYRRSEFLKESGFNHVYNVSIVLHCLLFFCSYIALPCLLPVQEVPLPPLPAIIFCINNYQQHFKLQHLVSVHFFPAALLLNICLITNNLEEWLLHWRSPNLCTGVAISAGPSGWHLLSVLL